MSLPAVIGLGYQAQHGKDTVADILHDLYGYEKIAFADKLREAVLALDPWVDCGDEFGAAPVRVSEALGSMGYEKAKKAYEEYRRSLQRMGTEVGRNVFGENFWVDLAFAHAPEGKLLVVSDMRFPNEYDAVLQRGGQVWHVHRPGMNAVATTHPSETAIAHLPFDHTLVNDGSLKDLADKVIAALEPSEVIDKAKVRSLNYNRHFRAGATE